MLSPLTKLTNLTAGMHPAVKIGLLIAAAAVTWYAVKTYQQSNKQPDLDPE